MSKPDKVAFAEKAAFYGRNPEADARLYGAAREMLEALKACDEAFAMWQVGGIPGRPEDILKLIVDVRSAIAKATGKS